MKRIYVEAGANVKRKLFFSKKLLRTSQVLSEPAGPSPLGAAFATRVHAVEV